MFSNCDRSKASYDRWRNLCNFPVWMCDPSSWEHPVLEAIHIFFKVKKSLIRVILFDFEVHHPEEVGTIKSERIDRSIDDDHNS